MDKGLHKTNAARLLDRARVAYRLVAYDVDPSDLSATHVAATLGADPTTIYKTLVLIGDRTGTFACVVPGNREVDLKKAAAASGNKKAEMLPLKDLLPTTGYIRGGCTAIGMKKPMPVYIQEDVLELSEFYVSAGQRGLQIAIAPTDYIAFTSATPADVCSETILV